MTERSEHGERQGHVGVRELRQNLSVYLDRVKEGETLVVTEHGHAVARLAPLQRAASILDRLVAEGHATPSSGSVADLGPPDVVLPAGQPTLTESLLGMRDEERW